MNPLRSLASLVRKEHKRKDNKAGYASAIANSILEESKQSRTAQIDRYMFPATTPRPARSSDIRRAISFLSKNEQRLDDVAALLDPPSRDLLARIFVYRALGPVHVTLPHTAEILASYDEARPMKVGESLVNFPPYEVSEFLVPFEGHQIEVECWLGNVVYTFLRRQYYFQRGYASVAPQHGDVVIDAGACFGDTALAFAATVGPNGHVHSFEPMPRQIEILRSNIDRNRELASNISIHPYALSDVSDHNLTFRDTGASARLSRGLWIGPSRPANATAVTKRLDDLIGYGIDRVDFIKMDIEGGELAAIEGAADTIRRFRPRLGISIYHSIDDLINIPLVLGNICQDYDFYIDHYTTHEWETILYAVPR